MDAWAAIGKRVRAREYAEPTAQGVRWSSCRREHGWVALGRADPIEWLIEHTGIGRGVTIAVYVARLTRIRGVRHPGLAAKLWVAVCSFGTLVVGGAVEFVRGGTRGGLGSSYTHDGEDGNADKYLRGLHRGGEWVVVCAGMPLCR